MLDTELKAILGQMIDNQFTLIKKIDNLTTVLSNLTNTMIKWDNEYQQEIVKEG